MILLKRILLCMSIVGMLVGGGCKEDEEDDLKVSTEPTNENVCAEAAEVVCHNAFQCCVGAELENVFGVEISTTEKDCRRDVELKCKQKYATLFYSLEKERINLRLPKIKQCLTQSLAPSDACFPYEVINEEQQEECDDVKDDLVTGLVAVDGACEFDYECAGEAICTESQKCKSLHGLGQACTDDAECLSSLHCSRNTLLEDVCTADVVAGGRCARDKECAEGLYCNMVGVGLTPQVDTDSDTATVPPGTCAAPQANGAACSVNYLSNTTTGNYTSDRECVSGNCLPGTCVDGRGDCETNADCAGRCSLSGSDCYTADDCTRSCSGGYNDGDYCDEPGDCRGSCSLDSSICETGLDCESLCVSPTGSVSYYECTTNADCDSYMGSGSGYTCQPQTCDGVGACTALETCNGVSSCAGRVCAEEYNVMNYCYMGWHWFNITSGD
ncbi:MAG: hypothetical protein JXR76_27550 [Deltaproteobacteria bacterium]|nr:hypothetical protein [Deltaproteobacteria bacterium]